MIFKWIGLLISYTFYDIKFVYQVFIYVYQNFIYTALRRSFDSLIKVLLFKIYIYNNNNVQSNSFHRCGSPFRFKKKKNFIFNKRKKKKEDKSTTLSCVFKNKTIKTQPMIAF